MPFTQVTSSNLDNTINTKLAAAEAANAAVANIVSLAISSVQIADSSYNVLDDTAANTSGGYLVINGTGFTNQCVVIVGTTNATSTTFANTKQLRAQVPGLAAATYPLYVVDSVTGATAIKVNGLTYSSFPAWSTGSTLSNQAANTSFSVNLSASSDSSVTYANTTALPAGTTLAANGLFSGTVTIGAQTTYSFDVKATDAENQDVSRTFSLTVTVIPQTRLWLWGFNNYGQLGTNDRIYKSSPTQIGTETTWNTVAAIDVYSTDTHVLATKTDGTAWAWGRNTYGQLGINNTIHRSSPVQIGSNTNWSIIIPGGLHTLAIKTDGTLWAWGVANDGRLGNLVASGNYKSSPTQIGTDTTWSNVATSERFAIATKTDNTLWSWGGSAQGQLGRNNTTYASSPVQISGTTWSQTGIAVGRRFCLAVKTDGTLWGWGNNLFGQLGLNNQGVYRSSPVQVGAGTNWSLVNCGEYTSLATKTDGTLWAFGRNNVGQLGVSDRIDRSSPTQVGTGTNWSLVSGGSNAVLAIKTNGTLWTWGEPSAGSTGLNDGVSRSSPTQIGTGTNWSKISAGVSHSAAITAN